MLFRSVTSTLPLLTFTGVEDTFGHIDITVASTNTFSGLYGSLGSVLDGLLGSYGTGNVEMDALIDELYGMNSATDVNNAIKQLQPHMTAGVPQITVDTLHGTSNVILARLDESRGFGIR